MGKYIPQLGDVIMDNGIPMVVVTIKNHECIGDCSYDREYFICEEEYICKCGCLSCMDEMKQHGRWIRIQGVEFPNIEQAEGYAPYEIIPIESYKFRQKKAKTVITYE